MRASNNSLQLAYLQDSSRWYCNDLGIAAHSLSSRSCLGRILHDASSDFVKLAKQWLSRPGAVNVPFGGLLVPSFR